MKTYKTKVSIAVVGLNFGSSFAEIYKAHPDVEYVGICDSNEDRLRQVGDRLQIQSRHTNLAEVLKDERYNAVHICTPVNTHAALCCKVMLAGKHCASAVPMGMTLGELHSVIDAQRKSKMNYMMMETSIYTSEYLYAKKLYKSGELGSLQLLQGSHSQDLEYAPAVWKGFPPMLYITHAISPLLDLADTRTVKAMCLGSGVMRAELHKQYNNPYPAAMALFRLEGTSTAIEITRTIFEVSCYGGEGFGIYGSKASIMTFWPTGITLTHLAPPVPGEGRHVDAKINLEPPSSKDMLPDAMKPFSEGGHSGSHPHLVHEFISSIVEKRRPYIDTIKAANWCAPGICANESMKKDGEPVAVPCYE
jgi:predicted dehydrogenase